MGVTRGPVGLWSEGPRVTGAPLCAKCSSVACGLNLVVLLLCTSGLIDLSVLGESVSPFIDEGDGLTSERGRVCVR